MSKTDNFLMMVLENVHTGLTMALGYEFIDHKFISRWKTLLKFTLNGEYQLKDDGHFSHSMKETSQLEVLFSKIHSLPLKEEDYCLLTTDTQCGQLYLPVYSTNPGKKTFSQNFLVQLHDRQKVASTSPQSCAGWIQLGKLVYSSCIDLLESGARSNLVLEINKYQKIKDLALKPSLGQDIQNKGSASYDHPLRHELNQHLDLVPYLRIPFEFDHEGCLQEAMELLDQFVIHRPYEQTSNTSTNWKSLALHGLDGDKTKTHCHSYYGNYSNPTYKLTEIAKKCPKTLQFLSKLTTFEQCERVRFMLLEPGAKIKVHSDAPNQAVAVAINIALNMPQGCHFYIDSNSDGSHNSYTKMIPFKAGNLFMVNVAKYHYVENNSNIPRLHIIVHGPLNLDDKELLQLARQQNSLPDSKALLRQLIIKYAFLGMDLDLRSNLLLEWKTQGLSHESLPSSIGLVVTNPVNLTDSDLRTECVHQITLASLCPLKPIVVDSDQLDPWLQSYSANSTSEFVVIIAAGTLVGDPSSFVIELLKAISQMRANQAMICGHIINRQDFTSDAPHLHEQFTILDIEKYRKATSIALGSFHLNQLIDFPNYLVSTECVHDDYTPLWIRPTHLHLPSKKVKGGWGTPLIAASLALGMPVINVPSGLRKTKLYAYPHSHANLEKVRAFSQQIIHHSKQTIFFFNNENLKITQIPNFLPDCLISVAAGLKPAQIANQYWKERELEHCIFIDYSKNALEYLRELTQLETKEAWVDTISKTMLKCQLGTSNTKEFVHHFIEKQLQEYFDCDFQTLRMGMSKLSKARYTLGNFMSDHDIVLNALLPGTKTILWHSNSWNYRPTYFEKSRTEMENNYLELGAKISKNHQLKGWKHKELFQMIFGTHFEDPSILLTDGTPEPSFNKDDYFPIIL